MAAIKEKGFVEPPKTIFLPSKEIIRMFIKANIKWGRTDTEENFLMRFGLMKNP